MTDLRTRIAATVDAHERVGSSCKCGFGLGVPAIVEHWQEHLADAVISELQLTKRLDANRAIPQFHYVTPWEKA